MGVRIVYFARCLGTGGPGEVSRVSRMLPCRLTHRGAVTRLRGHLDALIAPSSACVQGKDARPAEGRRLVARDLRCATGCPFSTGYSALLGTCAPMATP